ncbi:3747_t:CDS:1, partial [Racocetra persica]
PHDDIQVCLSIEELMSDEDKEVQRDLFLQGFAEVQRKKHNDINSFYQVAGIHGLPEPAYCRHS